MLSGALIELELFNMEIKLTQTLLTENKGVGFG